MLIDEVSQAAYQAIEQAASEAAKAAALAALERESTLLHLTQYWRNEAEMRQREINEAKKAGVKNVIITGVICFLSGFVIGTGTIFVIGGSR